MRIFIYLFLASLLIVSCETKQDSATLSPGNYSLSLDLGSDTLVVPVSLTQKEFIIRNAKENIHLDYQLKGDTLTANFKVFDSGLNLIIDNENIATGQWIKFYKEDYSIPVVLSKSQTTHNSLPTDSVVKYEVKFSPKSEEQYPAIGLFQFPEKDGAASGNFATETGDYRFLTGQKTGNKIALSTFDGSHAFLFTAEQEGDSLLNGMFYSGNHWKEPWIAGINKEFTLTKPDSLSKVTEEINFAFTETDSNLFEFNANTFKDTAVIIQILGSWCPNCLDETYFLSDLQSHYKGQPLQIIGIAFETKTNFAYFQKQMAKLKNTTGVNYPLLLGGKASKQLATDTLGFVDQIISFPTTIFLDKQHKIKRVHTGFYGPATGSYFEKFKEDTYLLVDKMLE